ncbi:MAG: hypothetical protein KF805_07805 [Phycisphaeraceae bacterium]|nr:hypothetical protein [Phycisphaeraceae bacterium]
MEKIRLKKELIAMTIGLEAPLSDPDQQVFRLFSGLQKWISRFERFRAFVFNESFEGYPKSADYHATDLTPSALAALTGRRSFNCSVGAYNGKPRLSNLLWEVRYSDSQHAVITGTPDPSIVVTANLAIFMDDNGIPVDDYVWDCARLLLQTPSAYGGFVDFGNIDDTNYGTYYMPEIMFPIEWKRLINLRDWTVLGKKRHMRIRDLYWGQLLGPKMAQHFDPDRTLTEEYKSLEWKFGRAGQIAEWQENGALFLTLSGSIFDSMLASPEAIYAGDLENAAWLAQRFRMRGMY